MVRNIASLALVSCLLLAAPAVFAGGVPKDSLDEYGRGIIEDYSDMKEGDPVEWFWVAPGVKLGDFTIDLGEFENLSKVNDERMLETLGDGLSKAFARAAKGGGKKGTLTTENAVYWAERGNSAKRWIPVAGGHLAQAGIGVEMVFKDAEGNVVAKLRHSGREGAQPADAAWELVDEVAGWVYSH